MSGPDAKASVDAISTDFAPHQIAQLVHQLVGRLISPSPTTQTKLTQYALRILGSRLPPTPITDEYALISLMKKYCT